MRYSSSGGSPAASATGRRKRRQRQRGRVDGVDVDLHVLRQLVDRAPCDRRPTRLAKSSWTILMKIRLVLLARRCRPAARPARSVMIIVAERLLALGDLLRIVGALQVGTLLLGLVVDLHVGLRCASWNSRVAAPLALTAPGAGLGGFWLAAWPVAARASVPGPGLAAAAQASVRAALLQARDTQLTIRTSATVKPIADDSSWQLAGSTSKLMPRAGSSK